jgi:phosphoserine phosphatase RsbU/P
LTQVATIWRVSWHRHAGRCQARGWPVGGRDSFRLASRGIARPSRCKRVTLRQVNTQLSLITRNESGHVEIRIRDNGNGIPKEALAKIRKKIKENEFEFVFADNGQEALDKLQEDSSIDLVMSDINMPVMDGLTFLSRLSDFNRIMKAVIVSAYGDMQNIRTAMNRGAYDFLMKPIDFLDFEVTVNKTRKAMEEIRQGTQAKEQLTALQYELSVASRIQQSILPRKFPPFPDRKEFTIFASMTPAREVGGDFYDSFFIDQNRLGFVIGDVSGKGVPAVIFMAVSRTLLRATAMQGISAGECLGYVNSVLCRQSDPSMFVTIFYGILHTNTGELEYSVGGHNRPIYFCPLVKQSHWGEVGLSWESWNGQSTKPTKCSSVLATLSFCTPMV